MQVLYLMVNPITNLYFPLAETLSPDWVLTHNVTGAIDKADFVKPVGEGLCDVNIIVIILDQRIFFAVGNDHAMVLVWTEEVFKSTMATCDKETEWRRWWAEFFQNQIHGLSMDILVDLRYHDDDIGCSDPSIQF